MGYSQSTASSQQRQRCFSRFLHAETPVRADSPPDVDGARCESAGPSANTVGPLLLAMDRYQSRRWALKAPLWRCPGSPSKPPEAPSRMVITGAALAIGGVPSAVLSGPLLDRLGWLASASIFIELLICEFLAHSLATLCLPITCRLGLT